MILVFAAETSMLATFAMGEIVIVPSNATRFYVPGPYDRPAARALFRPESPGRGG
jgi:hypothetical protein